MWYTSVARTDLNAGPRAPTALMSIANHVRAMMRIGKNVKCETSMSTRRRESVVPSRRAHVIANSGVSHCPMAAVQMRQKAYAMEMGVSLRSRSMHGTLTPLGW